MKKFFFSLKAINQVQLVKGCPTDINGDGLENDDYNHDGNTDQYDQDYYDGYMDGYDGDLEDGEHSDAYHAGQTDGNSDAQQDHISFDNNGQDILQPDFAGGYY